MQCHFKIIFSKIHRRFPLKGQSNEIFDLQFFSSFEPAWATDQWVKIFLILIKFSLSYSSFYESPQGIILRSHTAQSHSPWGIILRRVDLPGVSNCAESISLRNHAPVSHLLKFVLKSPWIPRRVNLPGVPYYPKVHFVRLTFLK